MIHSHETFSGIFFGLGSGGEKLHLTSAWGFIAFTKPVRIASEEPRVLQGYSIPHFFLVFR